MKSRSAVIAVLQGLVLAFGIAALSPSALAQSEKPARKDMVLKDDAKCTRCHDETEEYPVLSIGKTKHGTRADQRTPTCTSCHGESDTHANKPEGAIERPAPERGFSKRSKTPMEDRSAACLTCHQGGKRIHWQRSLHASSEVTCASCHKVHATHDPARDKMAQTEVCYACHKEQRAQMMRPYRHPVAEGKVACSDCHNPHGSAGPKNMVRDSVNDTCFTCHMEKRGPFVRSHQPVQEDCSICHNPHGTSNPSLLKVRAPFLCQTCHEPRGHPSTAPDDTPVGGGNPGTSQAVIMARGCVNCHTNIHGSNNPFNDPSGRGFRR